MSPAQICCACIVTNNQLSDQFNNGWKKQNGRSIAIFRILRQ